MQHLAGKVAIITGVSAGMGLATRNAFLAAGCKVLGVDISPEAHAPKSSTPYHFLRANLTDRDSPAKVVEACQKAFGPRIDALCNVAGILDYSSSAATVRDAEWEKVLAVNLTAPTMLMREVLKVMLKQKSGSIVNVASKAGQSGAVSGVAYTASKHGLVGVTKNTAWIHKHDGIRVNAIAPGAVVTDMTNGIKDGAETAKIDQVVQSRIGPVLGVHCNFATGEGVADPSTCADLMVFLASDLSHGVNGTIIASDNAFSCI